MKKYILLILFISVSISNFAQDETVNGNLTITNGTINLNSTSPTDPYTSISFRHQNQVKWLMDYGTSTTDDFRILKFNSATSASSFLNLDFANNQFEILNSNVGIGTTNPIEKLHIEGSLLLDAYQSGNQKGLFFREGFSATNKYNLSILTYDDGDNSPDALDINAYDGIYFNTGSNIRNPRMTIKGNGNVGIGTTNPEEKLQIGNAYTFHDGGHKVIGFLYKPSGAVDLDATKYSSEIRFDPTHGNFFLGTSSTITEAPTARLSINKNGYVGIGTTNPIEKLKIVNGSVSVDSSSDGSNAFEFGNNYGQMYYDAQSSGEQNRGMYFQEQLSTNRGFHFLNSNGDRLLKINGNGTVGIGTNNTQGYKLGVKGKIAAEEVKVALYNGWPDYVFEEDYDLPTLKEVEQHISEKGHLENIPSAAEVAENGIQLGEMNKKLLEKIEQLTLYMIEQNKKTEQLIKKSEMLQEEINLLKQQVKR